MNAEKTAGVPLFNLTPPARKWLSFLAGLLLLYAFAFVFLPFMSDFLGFTEAHQIIIDEKIEAGAWFWIFVEKIGDIEPRVYNTIEYTPGSGQ